MHRHSSTPSPRSRPAAEARDLPEPRRAHASERIPPSTTHSHRAPQSHRASPAQSAPMPAAQPTSHRAAHSRRSAPAQHAATSQRAMFASFATGALIAGAGAVLSTFGPVGSLAPQAAGSAPDLTPAGMSRPDAATAGHAPRTAHRQTVDAAAPRRDMATQDDTKRTGNSQAAERSGAARAGSPESAARVSAQGTKSSEAAEGATRTGSPRAARSNSPADDAAPARTIMIIRHGEKPLGKGSGIDAAGNPDTHSLTSRGWSRAHGLANLLDGDGPERPGLARPKTIFAAGANDGGEGTRTRETVSTLAGKLGVPVNSSLGKGDEAALAAKAIAASNKGPVLISWQHGEIPAIAEAFHTVGPTPPASWPDDRFDMVWTLTDTGNGWRFSQVPEMVLPGDTGQPFS